MRSEDRLWYWTFLDFDLFVWFWYSYDKIFHPTTFFGRFDAVIHFAGLKAVGDSVAKPLLYYSNNLISTITLLDVMVKNNCKNVRASPELVHIYHPSGSLLLNQLLQWLKWITPFRLSWFWKVLWDLSSDEYLTIMCSLCFHLQQRYMVNQRAYPVQKIIHFMQWTPTAAPRYADNGVTEEVASCWYLPSVAR